MNTEKEKTSLQEIVGSIQKRLDRNYEKPIYEWDNLDLDKFLHDSNSASGNTLNTYLNVLRKIHKESCKKQGLDYKELKLTQGINKYISLEKLLAKTPFPQDIISTRDELLGVGKFQGNIRGIPTERYNYRDAVLLQLGRYGLTSSEVANLLVNNIEFENDKKIKLHLFNDRCSNCGHTTGHIDKICPKCESKEIIKVENRVVTIDDETVINDIKYCCDEVGYININVYGGNPRSKYRPYVYSPYLIKGIQNGWAEPGKPVAQPNRILQKQLIKINHPILDMEHLSLEDLRRSMILQMIFENPNVEVADLKNVLDKVQDTDLLWLKSIAPKLKELREAKEKELRK